MWLVEVLSYLVLSHIPTSHLFRQRAEILNNYASVVLDSTPNVFCWCHTVFNHVAKNYYLLDSVHLNCAGQYQLYHSYRLVFFAFYFDFYLDVVPSTVVHGPSLGVSLARPHAQMMRCTLRCLGLSSNLV